MSTWLELINEIKYRFTIDYLTPTQKSAFDVINQFMRFPNWVNLYGPHGAGKSFLAWAVARTFGATYVPSPEKLKELQSNHEWLIIDNSPYLELDVRNIFALCGIQNCFKVLIITQKPITMPINRVELSLPSHEDIETVVRTLARLGYIYNNSNHPEMLCFWDIITACV